MRKFWDSDYPTGDPLRGAPFGERLDPGTISPGTTAGIGKGLGVLGTVLNIFGNNKAAGASVDAGNAQQAEANFEAAQIRQNAGQVVASSQRDAANEALKTQLMASRAAAVVAAGGGAVTDPTITKVIGDISGQGAYNQGIALYQGEERARQMNLSADAKTYSGQVAAEGGQQRAQAYRIKGLSGGITGAGSLFSKYGQGGFGSGTTPADTTSSSTFDA